MIILGIESTAHTFGIGIVNDQGKVLANEIDSFTAATGMIPDQVAEHHKQVADDVLKKALKKTKLIWEKIDFIAYAAGPGLDPVLWEGYHKAKEWSQKFNKELKGINHCCAHLSIGKKINNLKDPVYLYVSGVNTQIINYEGGKYRVMGETLDIGLGNMLDKLGRTLDLGFPAGPKIEELAKEGKYVELPYVVKGMDTSFSGILSKSQQLYAKGISKEDLCFSVQETCFAMLAEVSERALAHTGKKELLLVGGVGANQRFCQMLNIMCQERDAQFFKVPLDLAGDQGAMIAWEGFLRKDETSDVEVKPHWRVDEV
tara:strand:- start:31 stop:975 length:945 start_codon:yes stop_codon:yes gene_type:complete